MTDDPDIPAGRGMLALASYGRVAALLKPAMGVGLLDLDAGTPAVSVPRDKVREVIGALEGVARWMTEGEDADRLWLPRRRW